MRDKTERARPEWFKEDAPEGAPDYVEAEAAERVVRENIVGPPLTGEALLPSSPERVLAEPVTSVSRDPLVHTIIDDLYAVMLHQARTLREEAETPGQPRLDSSAMAAATKAIEGTKALTKLRLEMERLEASQHDQMSKEDLEKLAVELVLQLKDGGD